MTTIEQKLTDEFRNASLEFDVNDNKIQNKFGDNICRLEPYQTAEDYESVINLLTELKTKIPDLEERVDDLSTKNISFMWYDKQADDRNKLSIELVSKNDDNYNMKLSHDYTTTVYKDNYYFWQADCITKDVHMTPSELSEFILQMRDEIKRGDDIQAKQRSACEQLGFKTEGDISRWNIDRCNEVDPLPNEMSDDSYSNIALLDAVDDYILHVYEIDGVRHAMITTLSFPIEDELPSILGSLLVPCDDIEDHIDAFVSDFKSFKNICRDSKKEMSSDLIIEPVLTTADFTFSDDELTL